MGRSGNGLGDVWSGASETSTARYHRLNDKGGADWASPIEEAVGGLGLPEIILALSALTERQRFVVSARYGLLAEGERLPRREIASLMGITQQAVTRIEQRALKTLRRRLQTLVRSGS